MPSYLGDLNIFERYVHCFCLFDVGTLAKTDGPHSPLISPRLAKVPCLCGAAAVALGTTRAPPRLRARWPVRAVRSSLSLRRVQCPGSSFGDEFIGLADWSQLLFQKDSKSNVFWERPFLLTSEFGKASNYQLASSFPCKKGIITSRDTHKNDFFLGNKTRSLFEELVVLLECRSKRAKKYPSSKNPVLLGVSFITPIRTPCLILKQRKHNKKCKEGDPSSVGSGLFSSKAKILMAGCFIVYATTYTMPTLMPFMAGHYTNSTVSWHRLGDHLALGWSQPNTFVGRRCITLFHGDT